MPKVYNKHDPNVPADAVYVGRPTKWGNPFSHQSNTRAQTLVGSREEAVFLYRHHVRRLIAEKLVDLEELRGKDLVCWCAPLPCHADVLLQLANQPRG